MWIANVINILISGDAIAELIVWTGLVNVI